MLTPWSDLKLCAGISTSCSRTFLPELQCLLMLWLTYSPRAQRTRSQSISKGGWLLPSTLQSSDSGWAWCSPGVQSENAEGAFPLLGPVRHCPGFSISDYRNDKGHSSQSVFREEDGSWHPSSERSAHLWSPGCFSETLCGQHHILPIPLSALIFSTCWQLPTANTCCSLWLQQSGRPR